MHAHTVLTLTDKKQTDCKKLL